LTPARAWLLVGLLVVNAALLVGGAGLGDDGAELRDDRLRIGLVFDIGGLGDRSFNDSANRGLQRASAELDVETHAVEPGDGSDRESHLREFASQGYDLVIGVGFIFSEDIRKLAADFPEVAFACVDYAPPESPLESPPNLAGLRFREHEGSFLVGAIAGLSSRTKRVGFIGGMKIPLIRKFEAGYIAGVRHVCPECKVSSAYAGNTPAAFADSTKGKELALAQYKAGADIIYHAAGKTGMGVFGAARETGQRAIGVDSDQFEAAPCCVMTSMVKNVDVAVFDVIRDVVNGEFRGGMRELGLAENGVHYVRDRNNRGMLTDAVVERVEVLRKAIIARIIEVPSR
jgi:basic membrane protein A